MRRKSERLYIFSFVYFFLLFFILKKFCFSLQFLKFSDYNFFYLQWAWRFLKKTRYICMRRREALRQKIKINKIELKKKKLVLKKKRVSKNVYSLGFSTLNVKSSENRIPSGQNLP